MDELIKVVVDDSQSTDALNRIAAAGQRADTSINNLGKTINQTTSATTGATQAANANVNATGNQTSAFQRLQSMVTGTSSAFQRLAGIASGTVTTGFSRMQSVAQSAFQSITNYINNSSNALNNFTRQIGQNQRAMDNLWRLTAISAAANVLEAFWDRASAAVAGYIEKMTEVQRTMSLLTVVAPGQGGAEAEYKYIMDTADKYGVRISALTNNYAKLAIAAREVKLPQETMKRLFESTAIAARVMHMENSQVSLTFQALTQMMSRGVVSMEELRRQFAERVPGAIHATADALGTTYDKLVTMVSKGKVMSDKLAPYIANALIKSFGPGLQNASSALDAELNRINNSFTKFFKQIYDAGGDKGPAEVLRAFNDKLSNPEIAKKFAAWVDTISADIKRFIESITMEDIQRGAQTFIDVLKAIGDMAVFAAKSIKWLSENLTTVGGLLGAYMGAKIGFMVAGPPGAAVGAAIGGIGGALGGSMLGSNGKPAGGLQPNKSAGVQSLEAQLRQQNSGSSSGTQFNSADLALLGNLPKVAVKEVLPELANLPKVGQNGNTLESILGGPGKPDKNAIKAANKELQEQKDLIMELNGFNKDFIEDWERLGRIFNSKANQKDKFLSENKLVELQQQLIEQQPFMKAIRKEEQQATKQSVKEWEEYHKQLEKVLDDKVKMADKSEEELQKLTDEAHAYDYAKQHGVDLATGIQMIAAARAADNYQKALGESADAATLLALQREMDAREKILKQIQANDIRDTAEDASKKLTKNQEQYWDKVWNTIDNTGRDVFKNIAINGKSAFKQIGQQIKSSVLDLIYEMTIRPILIQVGQAVFGGQAAPGDNSGGFLGAVMRAVGGDTNAAGKTNSSNGSGVGGVVGAIGNAAGGNIGNIVQMAQTGYSVWNGTSPLNAMWNTAKGWLGLGNAAGSAGAGAITSVGTTAPLNMSNAAMQGAPVLGQSVAPIGQSLNLTNAAMQGGTIAAQSTPVVTTTATTASGAAAGGNFMGMATTNWVMLIMALFANAFGMFRKKTLNGFGLMGTLGGEDPLTPWEEWKKGGTLFSGSSFKTTNPLANYEDLRKRDLENIKKRREESGVAEGQPFTYRFVGNMYDAGAAPTTITNDANNQYNKDMQELAWNTKGQSEYVNKLFEDMRRGAVRMANGLGLAGDSMKNYTYLLDQQDLSFKDLDPEEIEAKINDTINKAGGEMLKGFGLIGTWITETVDEVQQTAQTNIANMDNAPEFESEVRQVERTRYVYSEFAKGGENALETLTRLYTSFNAVNDAADALGRGTLDASLSMASAADKMVEAFGGLEKFLERTGNYIQAYYSEEQQMTALAGRGSRRLKELGIDIDPKALRDIGAEGVMKFVDSQIGVIDDEDLADLMDIAVMIRPIFGDASSALESTSESAQEATSSLSDLQQRINEAFKSVATEGSNLEIQLLRLGGNEVAARIMEINIATAGWDENNRTLYASAVSYNRALQAQISIFEKLPALADKFRTPEQIESNNYLTIAANLQKAGLFTNIAIEDVASALQSMTKDELRAGAIAMYNMGDMTWEMREALVVAADATVDLKNANIELLKTERDRYTALTARSKELGRSIGEDLGGNFNGDRLKELWAIVNGSGDMETRLDAASNLRDILNVIAEKELEDAQTKLDNLQRLVDLGKNLRDYVDSLKIGAESALTPAEKMAEATKQFNETYTKAIGGDEDAQNKLTEIASSYLDLAKAYDPDAYGSIFDNVTNLLSGFSDTLLSENEAALEVQKNILKQAEDNNGLTQTQITELTKLQTVVGQLTTMAESKLVNTNAQLALATASSSATKVSVETIEKAIWEGGSVWKTLPANIAAALAPLLGQPIANYDKPTDTYTGTTGGQWSGSVLGQEAIKLVEAGRSRDLYNLMQKNGVTFDMMSQWTGTPSSAMRAWADANHLPYLATGTNFVPQDMLANIHKGEAVVPAKFNPWAGGFAESNQQMLTILTQMSDRIVALQAALTASIAGNTRAVLDTSDEQIENARVVAERAARAKKLAKESEAA